MKYIKTQDQLTEKRVTVKRRYTEKHPAKNISTSARIRSAVIEAIGDGVLTEEEISNILKELNAHSRWLRRNTKLFNISEDQTGIKTYGLSPFGKRVKEKTMSLHESLNEGVLTNSCWCCIRFNWCFGFAKRRKVCKKFSWKYCLYGWGKNSCHGGG